MQPRAAAAGCAAQGGVRDQRERLKDCRKRGTDDSAPDEGAMAPGLPLEANLIHRCNR